MTINQHAEQFHRILVKAGLRKPESTAEEHDIVLREQRMTRPIPADAPPTDYDPLAPIRNTNPKDTP